MGLKSDVVSGRDNHLPEDDGTPKRGPVISFLFSVRVAAARYKTKSKLCYKLEKLNLNIIK